MRECNEFDLWLFSKMSSHWQFFSLLNSKKLFLHRPNIICSKNAFSCCHESFLLVQQQRWFKQHKICSMKRIENSSHESWIKFSADFDFELIATIIFQLSSLETWDLGKNWMFGGKMSATLVRGHAGRTTKTCRNCFFAVLHTNDISGAACEIRVKKPLSFNLINGHWVAFKKLV